MDRLASVWQQIFSAKKFKQVTLQPRMTIIIKPESKAITRFIPLIFQSHLI